MSDVAQLRHHGGPAGADYLYNWTLRLLVGRLSWFGKRHQAQTIMHFAQVKGLPPRVIADYLSGLQRQATNIKWGHLMMPAKVDTPHNQRMLQIADTASGAVIQGGRRADEATRQEGQRPGSASQPHSQHAREDEHTHAEWLTDRR